MCHLLTAHQQEPFLPFSSWQSLSCYLSRVAKRSTPKPHGPLYSPSEPRGPLPFPQNHVVLFPTSEPRGSPLLLQNHMDLYLSTCFRASWFSPFTSEPRGSPHLLQSHMVSSPFTLELRGLLFPSPKPFGPPYYYGAAWSPPYLLWSRVVSSFLPQNLVVLLRQLYLPASPYSSSFSGLP